MNEAGEENEGEEVKTEYVVRYFLNQGDTEPFTTNIYPITGEEIKLGELPEAPEVDNRKFSHWEVHTGEGEDEAAERVSADMDIYAVYLARVAVRFVVNAEDESDPANSTMELFPGDPIGLLPETPF